MVVARAGRREGKVGERAQSFGETREILHADLLYSPEPVVNGVVSYTETFAKGIALMVNVFVTTLYVYVSSNNNNDR